MTHSIALSPTLRHALQADAVVSACAGLTQTVGGASLSSLLGLSTALLSWSGLFMLAYAASLLWLARGATRPRALIAFIVIGNFVWADACVVLWVFDVVSPTAFGAVWLLVQAAVVTALAVWQGIGWRSSSTVPAHGATWQRA
jgi:signal transduction histidine kinase